MATSIALGAGALATAAYLNAKYHIAYDLSFRGLAPDSRDVVDFVDKRTKAKRLIAFDILEEQSQAISDNTFLIFEGRSWTYKEFYDRTVKAANWLLANLKIEKGEIVSLYGGNSPDYITLWIAIESLGGAPSFINCNLTGNSLLHCVKLCKSRYVLFDADSTANVRTCEKEFQDAGIKTVSYDVNLIDDLQDLSPLPEEPRRTILPTDLRSLIYTSGTTGLPKATRIMTVKELMAGFNVSRYLKLKQSDRMYTCLPLYHGAAHGLCVNPTIHAGSSIVLSRKFSHKTFWREVRESNANILQYVGELCRYLVNAPPSPLDKQHNVEMAWGNGMRPDVWEPFRERFGIESINELYAATDGLGATFNRNRGEFSRHAIGTRGLIWRLTKGKVEKRVKIDIDTQEILRDENGFAIECATNEPGEAIHWLDPTIPLDELYYDNEQAGNKRLLRGVFKNGDLWFRSGDMMRQDEDGRVYFVDRLGDTFRWRSENVSTNEVSDVVGQLDQIDETNVIGVEVPKADGRCGCAAVVFKEGVTEDNFDFKGLAEHCLNSLPRYAVPGFVRLTKLLEYTGTFKIQKGRLRREGINPDNVTGGDKMYWLPLDGKEYVPFRREDYEALKAGTVRI